MKRPEISKQSKGISLRYGVSPTSEVKTYTPTISESEEAQIRKWVDDNYSLYSQADRDAAYRDAQKAVLDRKATVERKAILEKERKERAEKAAYQGNNIEQNQQKQLARAENAISDAAELIRQGQEMNGVRVDKTLTDKETVQKFLEANTETLFGEYVNKFLDNQTTDYNTYKYDNRWLAAKLGLADKSTERAYNARDKFEAGAKGYAQGLADIAQNTMGRVAEYVGSNIGAGLGEAGYWIAGKLGADTSEGTVWDKMKQDKGYTWKEAKKEASSEDLWRAGTLSEDQGAFNVGRNLGQLTTEIAMTAPLEAGLGSAIKAGQFGMKAVNLSKPVKTALQAANLAGGGAAFQLADDAANGERSNWVQYAKTAGLNTATAGLFSIMGKLTPKKLGYKLFAPKGQNETALLTQTPEQWAKKTSIDKAYAKDINAASNPYTEMANTLEGISETTYGARTAAGKKLEKVEGAMAYGETPYTAENVIKDLEDAFKTLGGGPNAKLPKFTIEGKNLSIDKEGLETLNAITRTSGGKDIKLGDEILNAWNNTFTRLDAPINAENTNLFIKQLKDILKDEGYNKVGGKTIRAMKNALNGVEGETVGAEEKLISSLTKQSAEDLKAARLTAKQAINTDENLKKVVGVLRNNDMVGKVGAAEKALGGKAQMQELFKEINEKYKIDMNNEILAWAYNMSLYDVKKAQQILDTFYPSTPGLIEAVLRVITKSGRRSAANKLVEGGKEYVESMNKYSTKPIVGGEAASVLSTRTNLMGENTRGEED